MDWKRCLSTLLPFVAASLLAGCASAPLMPLSAEHSQLDPAKATYLMSVVIRNDYRPRWQPEVLDVVLQEASGTPKPQVHVFRMDQKGVLATDGDGPGTYLIRFTASGSTNTLFGLDARARAFPIVGFYFVPLLDPLPWDGPGVYYLGSVKAVIREQKSNESRAGPLLPLVDQAVAGAATGTFEIEIGDAYDVDVQRFRAAFPVLADATITKSILPPPSDTH